MKTNLLICIIFIGFTVKGQNFSELYLNTFKDSWEKEPTEEMKAQVDPALDEFYKQTTGKGFWETNAELKKKEVLDQIEHYKMVLELKELDINTIQNFMLVEESNIPSSHKKHGFVIYNNHYFTYQYIPGQSNSFKVSTKYIGTDKQFHDSRTKIKTLLEANQIDKLHQYAKHELKSGDVKLNVQYEIMIYNSKDKTPLDIIYLHANFWS